MHEQLDRNFGITILYRVAFGFPYVGIDVPAGNQYVLEWSERDETVVPFLAGISNTPEEERYTIEQLRTGRYLGLKMYLDQGPVQARSVWEFYTRPILTVANDLELPITLHLPSSNLLKDLDEVETLATEFPRVTVIIAHMGGRYTTAEVFQAAAPRLKRLPNIVFDTSCCAETGVFLAALETFGPERILYGSDQPYNAPRRKRYVHPTKGISFMVDRLYSWVDPEEWAAYQGMNDDLVCIHLESLVALGEALERYGDRTAIQRIFVDNAIDILGV
jgi:predicted TIM-barrel fold metal-dependent hydrolase